MRRSSGALRRYVPPLLASVVLASACAQAPARLGGTVRVLGAWEGTERDAFLAVVAPFEAKTGIDVTYTSTRDLRGMIAEGRARHDPPDIAGLEGPAHMRELATGGALRDLTRAIDVQAYKADVAPTFIELGTVDGKLVGAFLKATVKGLLWFDPQALRMGLPESFTELKSMARTKQREPTREWCVGLESKEASGWPGTDWIETFLLHQAGLATYDRWVGGQLPWTSDEVRRAFEAFGQIVAPDAVFGGVDGALRTSFGSAGEPLFADPPGCLLMLQGSFMPAFFEAAGRRPGVDFDFMPFPEMGRATAGEVIGAGDLLGLLTDRPDAAALMDYLVGAEAQQTLVGRGGALSVNRRVSTYPNEVAAREAGLLSAASHFRFDGSDLMPAPLNTAFRHAVLDFTRDQSLLPRILAGLERIRISTYDS